MPPVCRSRGMGSSDVEAFKLWATKDIQSKRAFEGSTRGKNGNRKADRERSRVLCCRLARELKEYAGTGTGKARVKDKTTSCKELFVEAIVG